MAKTVAAPIRHVEKGVPLGAFASEAIVVCPKCSGSAVVKSESKYLIPFQPQHSRLVCLRCPFHVGGEDAGWFGPGMGVAKERCPNCGYKWLEARHRRRSIKEQGRRWAVVACPECTKPTKLLLHWRVSRYGAAADPAFGLPLWLQISCRGETLWAYNAAHLQALREYIAAELRERIGVMQWSMFSRLPRWMTARKNRVSVLDSMKRLERKLSKVNRAIRSL
jgi:hypothetical protein